MCSRFRICWVWARSVVPMRKTLGMETLVTGVIVGAVGTTAMDLLLFRRARASEGESAGSFVSWEFSTGADSFDAVGAPAAVAQRVASAAHHPIPGRHAGLANDAMHWATGLSWGMAGAVLASVSSLPSLATGVVVGLAAFGATYAVLAPLGIYDPIWEYDVGTLWDDLSAHLVFGAVTGSALAFERTRRSRRLA